MKFYEAVSIIVTLLAAFAFGVIARMYSLNPYPLLGISFLLFFFTYSFSWIYRYLEKASFRYVASKLLYIGRGIPRSFIRTQLVILEVSVLAILVTVAYMVFVAPRVGYSPYIPVLLVAFVIALGLSLIHI